MNGKQSRRTRNVDNKSPAKQNEPVPMIPSGRVSQETVSFEGHIGPLPSPKTLEEYNRANPGLAEMIVANAMTESNHRRQLEAMDLELSYKAVSRDQEKAHLGMQVSAVVAGLIIILAAFMTYRGYPTQASWVVGMVAAITTAYLGFDRLQNKQSNESPAE